MLQSKVQLQPRWFLEARSHIAKIQLDLFILLEKKNVFKFECIDFLWKFVDISECTNATIWSENLFLIKPKVRNICRAKKVLLLSKDEVLKALQSDFFVVLRLQVQITKTRAGPKESGLGISGRSMIFGRGSVPDKTQGKFVQFRWEKTKIFHDWGRKAYRDLVFWDLFICWEFIGTY